MKISLTIRATQSVPSRKSLTGNRLSKVEGSRLTNRPSIRLSNLPLDTFPGCINKLITCRNDLLDIEKLISESDQRIKDHVGKRSDGSLEKVHALASDDAVTAVKAVQVQQKSDIALTCMKEMMTKQ